MNKKTQAPLRTTPNTKCNNSNFIYKSILSEAQGRWFQILTSTGIDPNFLKNKHGPCPICGGKDRFRFDDKNGCGTFFCNHCGAGGGIRLLQLFHNCNFQLALAMMAKAIGLNANHAYPSSTKYIP